MEKEFVANMAEWNLEMLKNVDASVKAFVQTHKEHAEQVKDLMDQGFAHLEKLTAPVEQMVRQGLTSHPDAARMVEMPMDMARKMHDLQKKGAVQVVDACTRMVEQGAEQLHKGTRGMTELWTKARTAAAPKAAGK
jgi:hypothetical protein